MLEYLAKLLAPESIMAEARTVKMSEKEIA